MLLGEKEQPDEVVYRARIFRYANYSASHLVGFIEEWVEQGASISNGIFLQVTFDSDCPVRISNIDEPICVQQPNVAITLTLTSTSSPLISKTSSLPVSVLTSILTINPTSTGAAQSWDKLALSAIIASAILAVIVSVLITVVIVLLVHLRTQKKEV